MTTYIYQHQNWPLFQWDNARLLPLVSQIRYLQGKLIGQIKTFGFELQTVTHLETIAEEIIKSAEIEGEVMDDQEVRSSLARKLGIERAGLVASSREVDGMVDLLLDAIQNHQQILTVERLFAWHASLFPTGRSGIYKIIVGDWRDDSTGPMHVVSGAMEREIVHFQAPSSQTVPKHIQAFFGLAECF